MKKKTHQGKDSASVVKKEIYRSFTKNSPFLATILQVSSEVSGLHPRSNGAKTSPAARVGKLGE